MTRLKLPDIYVVMQDTLITHLIHSTMQRLKIWPEKEMLGLKIIDIFIRKCRI